jgi:hypothetical protein
MFLSCYDKDSAIISTTAAYLTSILLETGAGAKDCKCSRDQQFLPKHGGAQDKNFGHPSYD